MGALVPLAPLASGAMLAQGRLGAGHACGTSDIEVCPLYVFFNEFLKEGSRLAGTTKWSIAKVVEIRLGSPHRVSMFICYWHSPQWLEGSLAASCQILCKGVIV